MTQEEKKAARAAYHIYRKMGDYFLAAQVQERLACAVIDEISAVTGPYDPKNGHQLESDWTSSYPQSKWEVNQRTGQSRYRDPNKRS